MTPGIRGISAFIITLGVVLLLALPSLAYAKKGAKIPVGDDPSLKEGEGSPELVLVEVSDYQCFYCIKSAEQVIPQVYEWLVRRGKVEIVFLDMPLQSPTSLKAAKAAACAGDQNKFWEMHDRLFEHARTLPQNRFPEHAAAIGLDADAFQKCLDSRKHETGIHEDTRVARTMLGINGTPAFVIGRRVPGSKDKVEVLETIPGLVSYADLEMKLNAYLTPEPSKTPE